MDEQLVQTGRMPASSITRDEYRSGLVVLPIIGIIYLYGGIYILNKKYFYPAVSHIISLLDEKYTPIIYCSLNMMIYLFIMLYSTLLAQDNIGISTILGSEAFNLLFVIGWVQLRLREPSDIDPWTLIKDSAFYLGTIVFASIYFSFNAINWWQALIWLIYFFIYAIYFQKRNEKLRDRIALFFGLKDEDDVFSSEDLFDMPKRSYDPSELMGQNFIVADDPDLLKMIARNEGALRIQVKDQYKFEKLKPFRTKVYQVMFAIRKKVEDEKKQRSVVFREKVEKLYGRGARKQYKTGDDFNGEDDTNEIGDKRGDEDENLIENPNKSYPFESNNDDVAPNKTPNPTSQVDVLNRGENNMNMNEDLGNVEQELDNIPSNPNLDEMYVFEDDNMSIPNTFGKKIIYFLFFPLNFLYFVVLFYFRKQPNIKTASFSMGAILLLQAIFTFLIIWWTEIVIQVLDIDNEVAGVSFTSVGFSISFIVYNLNFQSSFHASLEKHDTETINIDKPGKTEKKKNQPNFLTTFQMVGIYKFGFAGAVAWLLSCAAEGIVAYPNIIQGLQIAALTYLGLFVLGMVAIGAKKSKLHRHWAFPFMGGYIGWFITAVLVLIYFRSQEF